MNFKIKWVIRFTYRALKPFKNKVLRRHILIISSQVTSINIHLTLSMRWWNNRTHCKVQNRGIMRIGPKPEKSEKWLKINSILQLISAIQRSHQCFHLVDRVSKNQKVRILECEWIQMPMLKILIAKSTSPRIKMVLV